MKINILVADDDAVLRKLICDVIKKQGYNPISAEDGQQALDLFFEHNDLQLCVLDVMMPKYTGLQVLEEIRQHSDIPVIMLTALTEEEDEIQGFLKGADDYISKPFSYPVLVARIENMLKKVKELKSNTIVEGEITFNSQAHEVTVSGQRIELNHKEFLLLEYFMLNKKLVLTREQILNSVWSFDYEGDIRTIDSHIKMLRKKLGNSSDYIKTIRGTGYKFEVSDNK